MKILFLFMTLVLATWSQESFADSAQLIIGTEHSGNRDYNEFNPGIGVEVDDDYTFGAVINSHGNPALYGGYVFDPFHYSDRRWLRRTDIMTGVSPVGYSEPQALLFLRHRVTDRRTSPLLMVAPHEEKKDKWGYLFLLAVDVRY